MPKSRHRKDHKKKVTSFKKRTAVAKNTEMKEYKNKMEEIYKQAQELQMQGEGKEDKPMKIDSGAISPDTNNDDNNLNKIKI